MPKPSVLLSGRNTDPDGVNDNKLFWRAAADLPIPVAGYMAGVRGRKLLIIGGSYWENQRKYWTDQVQSFDLRTNTWQTDIPLPAPRSDAASVTARDEIYIFGGGVGAEVHSDVLVLQNGKWHPLRRADLPEPRLYATAVCSGEFVYILGGMSKP